MSRWRYEELNTYFEFDRLGRLRGIVIETRVFVSDAPKPGVRPKKDEILAGAGAAGIVLTDSRDKIFEVLGKPDYMERFGDEYVLLYKKNMKMLIIASHDRVRLIQITEFSGKTPEGIGIGSSQDEVRNAYGPPTRTHTFPAAIVFSILSNTRCRLFDGLVLGFVLVIIFHFIAKINKVLLFLLAILITYAGIIILPKIFWPLMGGRIGLVPWMLKDLLEFSARNPLAILIAGLFPTTILLGTTVAMEICKSPKIVHLRRRHLFILLGGFLGLGSGTVVFFLIVKLLNWPVLMIRLLSYVLLIPLCYFCFIIFHHIWPEHRKSEAAKQRLRSKS